MVFANILTISTVYVKRYNQVSLLSLFNSLILESYASNRCICDSSASNKSLTEHSRALHILVRVSKK